MIPLADIDMISNYRDVEPVKPTDADVIELSNSIKNNGLLQAVLVRPHPAQAGRFELIFGHRRNVAAGLAGLKEIPANIKEVSDEDILELQVTENLQRKDVHPLDEAIAFQSLIRDKGYMIEDIAARFGKKSEFVTHRLKLNDLVPDLQKPFKKNLLSVGQAFVICRLRQEDQKTFRKEWKDEEFAGSSIQEMQEWINRNLLQQLSSASFKRDDSTLDPKAGPCTTCQKRSGCGNLLFNDLKEDDRCFDAACFQRKSDAFFARQLQTTIETKPEVHLIARESNKLPKEVKELLRQMNVKVLDDGKWSSYGYGKQNKPAKGFYLDGFQRGRTETIYVEGAAKATVKDKDGKVTVKRTVALVQEEIEGIQSRQKRALELDAEKVWEQVKTLLEAPQRLAVIWENVITIQEERNAMAAALLQAIETWEYKKMAVLALGLKVDRNAMNYFHLDERKIKLLTSVTDNQIAYLLRLFMIDKLKDGLSHLVNHDPMILVPVLTSSDAYLMTKISEIQAAQKEIAAKRIERADKRLKALREEKKELETKAKEKADKKAAAGKGAKETPAATPAKKAASKKTSGKKSAKATKLSTGIKSLLDQKSTGLITDEDPLGVNEAEDNYGGPHFDFDKSGDDPEDWK